jgi:hypothetical protein
MMLPLPALDNKTPGTDYSGEYSEKKTETKLLTEKAKLAAKWDADTTRGRRTAVKERREESSVNT